jgi:uncharacterized protein DUF3300/endosialidase-like protein
MVSAIVRALFLALSFFVSSALAQTSETGAPKPNLLKPEEIDQLVAPIALYPDPLLAQVLMASAYPLDIVQAERWLQSHKNLKGDQLKAALAKEDWDDSVKSLAATPDVLAMMSEKLDWTEKLGDAVVDQQPDVMDAIQRLRAKAQANDKLRSTKQQDVTVNQVQGKQIIAIEPADPDTIYVPYYDPAVVYGAWPYPDYPPYYWPPPPYIGYGLLGTGLAFGAGYAIGRWWSGGYWGGNINWSGGGNNINVTPPGNRPAHPITGNGGKWQPRVDHRQAAGNRGGQRDFRGSRGQQVLNPGSKPSNRPNADNRPGNRPDNRPGAGKKTGGGNIGQGNRPNKGAHVSHREQGQRANANARPSHRASNPRPSHRTANARPSHRAGAARPPSLGGRGGIHRGGGGGLRVHGGGGRGFGGGAGGRRGGRRSDIRMKHDIVLLGYLNDGLGLYRFSYNGSNKQYVGVMAQEVLNVMPEAVTQDRDGYLRVNYDKLGLKFQAYSRWLRSEPSSRLAIGLAATP